jgi:large subunit ribosomal protein L25
MSEVHTITANKRDRAGKGAARATRREGHVPGVIYGNKQSPVLIALDPREIDREIHKRASTPRCSTSRLAATPTGCWRAISSSIP